MIQTEPHLFAGMQQDTSISKQQPEYLIDAHNIRITAREGETLLSITNEKGPKELALKDNDGASTTITGTIVGHCVLNNYLVLFVTNNGTDGIFRIDMSQDNPVCVNLCSGSGFSLGFDADYPIEAIGDYENENIQKVYWVDGKNQPRVINIADVNGSPHQYSWSGAFDFVPELKLNETVTVTRNTGSSGQFPAGVIQYAFSYYNKYGQESNIFHTTPLYYISFFDRGGSPEAVISNAFKITVTGIDTNFDYLRIYSIQRTSLNGTPICKRVQDIAIDGISNNTISYTDTGVNGDNVDPTSLLYIGGEEVVAKDICTKDGTLFLGNIQIKRPSISAISGFTTNIQDSLSSVSIGTKNVTLSLVSSGDYYQVNGLNTQAAGFKNREWYRLGLQAQYKNGKWSEPVFIGDKQMSKNGANPSQSGTTLNKLVFKYQLSSDRQNELYAAGYRKVRPVVVFPELQDRCVLAQGVVNPTMYTTGKRYIDGDTVFKKPGSLGGQSSWFFRPWLPNITSLATYYASSDYCTTTYCSPYSYTGVIPYSNNSLTWKPHTASTSALPLRSVEIQGQYDSDNQFMVDWQLLTMHSPELTFDDSFINVDLTGTTAQKVGYVSFNHTLSDIDIQTSSPAISNGGAGFVHQAYKSYHSGGIISGLFYDDYVVDDHNDKFEGYDKEHWPVKWMVYAWHKTGSFNNDILRPANKGTRSAELSKKVISNLRYSSNTTYFGYSSSTWGSVSSISFAAGTVPQVFNSNEVATVKLGSLIYEGNIDTSLSPDEGDGLYFCFGTAATTTGNGTTQIKTGTENTINTTTKSTSWWKTWNKSDDGESNYNGLYKYIYINNIWQFSSMNDDIGDGYPTLSRQRDSVRMKYKSTAHIVLQTSSSTPFSSYDGTTSYPWLPVLELCRAYDENTFLGGTSQDAKKANTWLPAGPCETLVGSNGEGTATANLELSFEYGDTWYSRYDCLKTYPFTSEDPNQIVEIGSFMLETHINIDGRYDRNRGQADNTNMSPTNFNLFNPVYSQRDNFFSYRILDDNYYTLNTFPNEITWSTEKSAGSDVDPWTSVTLASVYDMDGSKGQIQALKVWKDNIYCFHDNGICYILFNSRVQIPVSDGVPIEIANNYKVDGKRYISDGVGCINKYSICSTPSALYFIDSVGKHLQAISDRGLMDLSSSKNMVTWFTNQDVSEWAPNNFSTKVFYDNCKKDLYIVTQDEALCFSEMIGEFTSFMSYENIPLMFNVVDDFYCIKSNYISQMYAGDYNYFFGDYKGFDFTFVSNGRGQQDLSTLDKIYSNINYRADKWSDKLDSILSSESPFDYVRLWNEYQDTGEVLLQVKQGKPSVQKKKFRVWRIQIPRDAHNRRDRIRNTWCKVKMGSAPRYNNGNLGFVQLHDVNVEYFT